MSFGWLKSSPVIFSGFGFSFLGIHFANDKVASSSPPLPSNLETSGSDNSLKSDLIYSLQPKTQEKIKTEAEEAYKKLNDYTMRLVTPCGIGTGWILDYQIAEEGKYPTTWYIATNAHVIGGFRFLDNPYEQLLPISIEKTEKLRKQFGNNHSFKRVTDSGACYSSKNKGYFDLGFAREGMKEKVDGYEGTISSGRMKSSRLFYLPNGFLAKGEKEYYRDFAVLELEFLDQEYAKVVTDNFANKYPIDSKKAINIFASSLNTRYSSWDELEESNENYYSLGYSPIKNGPNKGELYAYSTNWDEEKLRAGRLANNLKRQAKTPEEKVRGFVNLDMIRHRCNLKNSFASWCDNLDSLHWNKSIKEIGYSYLFVEKNWMGAGSSGSMYIDGKGNLLGIKNLSASNWAYVVPLVTGEISYKSISSPAYDLIRGGIEGQRTSYKQQVEKYVNNRGKMTWLQKRNWQHKT